MKLSKFRVRKHTTRRKTKKPRRKMKLHRGGGNSEEEGLKHIANINVKHGNMTKRNALKYEFIEVPQSQVYGCDKSTKIIYENVTDEIITDTQNVILFIKGLGPCRGILIDTKEAFFIGHLDDNFDMNILRDIFNQYSATAIYYIRGTISSNTIYDKLMPIIAEYKLEPKLSYDTNYAYNLFTHVLAYDTTAHTFSLIKLDVMENNKDAVNVDDIVTYKDPSRNHIKYKVVTKGDYTCHAKKILGYKNEDIVLENNITYLSYDEIEKTKPLTKEELEKLDVISWGEFNVGVHVASFYQMDNIYKITELFTTAFKAIKFSKYNEEGFAVYDEDDYLFYRMGFTKVDLPKLETK